jgi:hypothetical protein
MKVKERLKNVSQMKERTEPGQLSARYDSELGHFIGIKETMGTFE